MANAARKNLRISCQINVLVTTGLPCGVFFWLQGKTGVQIRNLIKSLQHAQLQQGNQRLTSHAIIPADNVKNGVWNLMIQNSLFDKQFHYLLSGIYNVWIHNVFQQRQYVCLVQAEVICLSKLYQCHCHCMHVLCPSPVFTGISAY